MRNKVSYRLLLLVGVLSVSIFSLNAFVILPGAVVVSDRPQQLLHSVFATFPGNNGQIAFSKGGQIYLMNADGSDQHNISNNAGRDEGPNWSPDGTKIAFTSNRDGNWEIYVMNADGSDQRRLTNNAANDGHPNWSPDGTKIAFSTNRDSFVNEIYVMNADGSNIQRLTNNQLDDIHPNWSPDGTKIAFSTTRPGLFSGYKIYIMNPDGSDQRSISPPTVEHEYLYSPNWSPDGTKIVYTTSIGSDIYIMNADGTNPQRLTNNPYLDTHPSWSPDGTKIAFETDRDEPNHNREIYIMNADGSDEHNISNNAATADSSPDWGTHQDMTPSPDTTAPVITVPPDITAQATTANGGTVVTYMVTAEDNVDGTAILEEDNTLTQDDDGGDISISCEPASGSEFPIGDIQVQCIATDAAGNSNTASFMVTVNPPPPDTTAPIIIVPEDMTVEATGPEGAEVSFEEEPSAIDDVDRPVDVTCDYNSGDTFPIGETVVTCNAEDAAGNSAEETFTVTVQDTTAPDVEVTEAVDRRNREVADSGTTPTPYIRVTFEATDAVGVDRTECSLDVLAFTSCTSPVVYDRLSRGTHEVIVRAIDDAGNVGEDEFTWTVGANPSAATPPPGRQ